MQIHCSKDSTLGNYPTKQKIKNNSMVWKHTLKDYPKYSYAICPQ